MHLPEPIILIFVQFQPLLTQPSYRKMVLLVCGTLLAHGRRTVTAALKILGLADEHNWSKYHNLLNRAKWSGLEAATIMLRLLVKTFLAPDAPIEIVVDETLERRWGRKIKKRCHWRDSLASSHKQNVTTSGLRWLVAALVVKLPWSSRPWALPFFSTILTTPKRSTELNLRHRTVTGRTSQLVKWLHRLFKGTGRTIKLIGDSSYSVIDLGLLCHKLDITLLAPIRMDARLFEPAPPRQAHTMGRPRRVGGRLPLLRTLALDLSQDWQLVELDWYGGTKRQMWLLTGTAVWYSTLWADAPLPVRWVLVRDPKGNLETKAFFSTDLCQRAASIASDFVKRWNIEVTFEESRAQLGVESQCQWNDLAIERSTPALLGLYSLVCLFANALYPAGKLPLYETAWYSKKEATFSDALGAVRRALWGNFSFETSPSQPDVCLVPRQVLDKLAFAACY
jgi:hypothetical protein